MMEEGNEVMREETEDQPSDIQVRIAERIRENSRQGGRLTTVQEIESLFTPEDPDVRFEEMMAQPEFGDLRWVVTSAGEVLLYSEAYLTPEQAEAESAMRMAMENLARHVRTTSKDHIALTPLEKVPALVSEALQSEAGAVLERMAASAEYADIQKVVGPTGLEYLYSDRHISGSYARILARAEANDPLATIAETVREESRVYPRPTPLATFHQDVFRIPPHELGTHVDQLLASEKYSDIKKIVLENGAVYLFSEQYLHPRLAECKAWDAEFGAEMNP